MIQDNDISEIGKLLKPHGINGEIVVLLTKDVDLSDLSCLVLNIDGINVPFYLTGIRTKSRETDLIHIDGVADEKDAMQLCGHTVFALISELPISNSTDGMYATDLIGYSVKANGVEIGQITAIDDTTANILFIIEKIDGTTCLIPIADDFIDDINPGIRSIDLSVPEELLKL